METGYTRGENDLDSAGQWRMVADRANQRVVQLEAEVGQLRAERDDLRRKLEEAWALLETRYQADAVEGAVGA